MQEEGFVAKLLFEEGANDVPLGTAIAVLVENKEDIAAFADFSADSASADSSSSAAPVETA
jgi:pyruvate dehydrogenase E2 component (dihydrolipoamide acetyltransferase)